MWEYEIAERIPSSGWERVLVERVMERGELADMRWLLRTFGRDRLRRFLEERGRRVLPPRELCFWSWACGVPDSVARQWVSGARERSWQG